MDPNYIESLIDNREYALLRATLSELDSVEIAQLLTHIPPYKSVVAFRLLPKDLAIGAFEQMDVEYQRRLLDGFTMNAAREFIQAMSADDRAKLLDEVPAKVARRLLRTLPPKELQDTLELLGYQRGTAGRLMIPEFVDLRENMTTGQAFDRIRRLGTARENIDYAFVIDDQRHLRGLVSLKDLVLAPEDERVADLMTPNPKLIYTYTDQEDAAKAARDYDMALIPIVDAEERLVGTVSWDDLVDVLEIEATEDIHKYGAVPIEHPYFATRLGRVVRQRGIWILILTLANTLTGAVIASQTGLLEEFVILAAFVPLLIDTGGSLGTQSSTVVIRGLAIGEVSPSRIIPVLTREAGVGILLGIFLSLVVMGYSYALGRDTGVVAVVGLTLVSISVVSTTAGAALPFLFQRIKQDPAVVSAPLITTIMDIVGVLIYFGIAYLVLLA